LEAIVQTKLIFAAGVPLLSDKHFLYCARKLSEARERGDEPAVAHGALLMCEIHQHRC
jgi:hypothetical protein